MLVGILGLYFYCGKTFNIVELTNTAPQALDGVLWWGVSAIKVIWVLLFIGFAIKVPVFPFHTWLPLAHVEAPTAISVLLAGILLKLGVYGIIRVNYGLMPDGVYWFSTALAFLGLVNVIWGGLCALAQKDLKKLVAYSSVNHMGYSLIGMAAVVAAGEAHHRGRVRRRALARAARALRLRLRGGEGLRHPDDGLDGQLWAVAVCEYHRGQKTAPRRTGRRGGPLHRAILEDDRQPRRLTHGAHVPGEMDVTGMNACIVSSVTRSHRVCVSET